MKWDALTTKALAGFTNLLAFMGLALFLPAGTLNFWEAWVWLAVFFLPAALITTFFLKEDPRLIERRLHAGPTAEKRLRQKIIQSMASLFFLLLVLVPAFDHRFHWSHVPAALALLADAGVLTGLVMVFFVFRENSFTPAVIEVSAGQRVISTGPYAAVRHPMYAGGLLLIAFTPVALGSWWGSLCVPPMFLVIVLRLLDEERFLVGSLPEYEGYIRKVRYRLIPGVW